MRGRGLRLANRVERYPQTDGRHGQRKNGQPYERALQPRVSDGLPQLGGRTHIACGECCVPAQSASLLPEQVSQRRHEFCLHLSRLLRLAGSLIL